MHETRAVARALERWDAARGEIPVPPTLLVEILDPLRAEAGPVDTIACAWLSDRGLGEVRVRVAVRDVTCPSCGLAVRPTPADPVCPACSTPLRPADGPAVLVTDAGGLS